MPRYRILTKSTVPCNKGVTVSVSQWFTDKAIAKDWIRYKRDHEPDYTYELEEE